MLACYSPLSLRCIIMAYIDLHHLVHTNITTETIQPSNFSLVTMAPLHIFISYHLWPSNSFFFSQDQPGTEMYLVVMPFRFYTQVEACPVHHNPQTHKLAQYLYS